MFIVYNLVFVDRQAYNFNLVITETCIYIYTLELILLQLLFIYRLPIK